MAISLASPVTGAAITGLTSPTYTFVQDTAPPVDQGVAKSWFVSQLGGTQTGVETHTIGSPFTVSWKHPKVLALPGVVDVSGVMRSPVKRNTYELITRKGGRPVVGQAQRLNMIRTAFSVEAGVETADPQQVLAMLSAHIGVLTQMANGIRDTLLTGAA